MSRDTTSYERFYQELWLSGAVRWPAAAGSRVLESQRFCSRHHTFRRNATGFGGSDHGLYVNQMFESVFECLACYRWFRIPERLLEICRDGWPEASRDIEALLDRAGYSASLIAEELFGMIDQCLESGVCTDHDLHAIRLAYNGLSGFDDPVVSRITSWGTVEDVLADESIRPVGTTPDRKPSGLLLLVESGLFDPGDRGHLRAAHQFLRMTSAV